MSVLARARAGHHQQSHSPPRPPGASRLLTHPSLPECLDHGLRARTHEGGGADGNKKGRARKARMEALRGSVVPSCCNSSRTAKAPAPAPALVSTGWRCCSSSSSTRPAAPGPPPFRLSPPTRACTRMRIRLRSHTNKRMHTWHGHARNGPPPPRPHLHRLAPSRPQRQGRQGRLLADGGSPAG